MPGHANEQLMSQVNDVEHPGGSNSSLPADLWQQLNSAAQANGGQPLSFAGYIFKPTLDSSGGVSSWTTYYPSFPGTSTTHDVNGNETGYQGQTTGGLGSWLASVAPLALSAFAPGLGTTIGSALGAGAAVAPIVGGAALGAGTAALTGGNALTGAVLGGLGGAGNTQIGDTGVTVGQVNTATNVAKNLESGNLLGAATGVSNLAGTGNTQIGDTGISVNDALNAAKVAQAASSGNIVGALSSATKLASSGSSPLNAAPIDQNTSPTLNTGTSTDVPVPGTGGLPADASSTAATDTGALTTVANNAGTETNAGANTSTAATDTGALNTVANNTDTVAGGLAGAVAGGANTAGQAATDTGTGALTAATSSSDASYNALSDADKQFVDLAVATGANRDEAIAHAQANPTASSGAGTQVASSGTGIPSGAVLNGASSPVFPPDRGAVWNPDRGVWVDPTNNGYWTMGISGEYDFHSVNAASTAPTSETATGLGGGTDSSSIGTGATGTSGTTADNTNTSTDQTAGNLTTSGLDTLSSTVASNQATNQSAIDAASKSISDVSTNLGNQISGVQSSLQSQLGDATSSLNQRIDQLVTSGMNAQDATNQAISELSSGQQASQQQISNVQSGLDVLGKNVASDQAQTQSQLAGMSAQEQSDVANLTQQGVSLQDAINKVSEQSSTQNAAVEGQISDLSKNLTSGLSANSQQINDVQSNLESQLNDQGKSLMDALRAQGEDYNTALNTAIDQQNKNFADYQAQTTGEISGVQSGLDVLGKDVAANQASTNQSIADVNTAVSNLDTKTQEEYNSLTDAQKAEAAQEAQNTGDLQKAISDTAANAAAATAALAASTADQNKSLSNQLSNMQAAQNLANQKPLDSSAQLLTSTDTGSKGFKLAQLHQLFNSLTPEMKSVLSEKGITPPAEEPMPETQAATGGLISDETQKVLDSLNPKFISAPTHLTSSMPQQQESRLGALRHIPQGVLKGSTLSNRMSHGGLPHKYAEAAPEGHNPEFITGLTGYYAQGGGTGQSDDIPAMLHDGDYVMDADTVAALGDGSSKAGAEVLEKMRKQIPHHDRAEGSPVPAKIADGEYVFPASFVTAIGGGSNKVGAERLNEMREKIRAHKRSAPTSKIPPKAKSPLDYLKMAKG